jgi:molybdopterin converting factor subunit 1
MQVHVKFFATYREIAGSRRLAWSAREGLTLRELVDEVLTKYPRLSGHRGTMLLAVNQAFASTEAVLHEGDEVAFLPPVSGGDH